MQHYINQLMDNFIPKVFISTAGAIIAYIENIYTPLIWGFLFLFFADWITGIIKSLKNGVKISSRRLRDSVTKLGLYMLLITTLIVMSKYNDIFSGLVNSFYIYYMLTEFKSIYENMEEMGIHIPSFIKRTTEVEKDRSEKK